MKKPFTHYFAKFSPKLILLALGLFLFLYSCKKEIFSGEKIDPARKKEMLAFKNGPQVEIIGLAQFKKKADLNALGALKQGFVNASPSKSKTMAINTSETYLGFNILTDSIKMINANGHTMYIFPVALSSKRAVTFQNLTIDESANGTVAFVNTYTPTKKWIAEWKKGRPGKFDGDISVTYLNINNGSTNATSASNKNTKTTISDVRNPNTVANAPICTTTSYYYEIPYACASGQHYPGEGGCYLSGEDRAGYVYIDFDVTICVEDPNPGGGGGGTTPTPPGGYNPCPTDPPMISSKKSLRAKLMAISPTPCDSVVVDCAGVPGGNAYWIASCNTCVGGTTGKTGCPPKEIFNNVKDPCIKDQVVTALTAKSTIGTMLNKTFGGTDPYEDFDLEIRDTTNLDAGVDGEEQRLSGRAFEIRLNKNTLPNYSKEYILATIYHEVLHAYFEQKFVKGTDGLIQLPETTQHNKMAEDYIALMAAAIHNAHGLNETEAWALAWGGLQETTYYNTKLNPAQKTYINQINQKHKKKSSPPSERSGTYCN